MSVNAAEDAFRAALEKDAGRTDDSAPPPPARDPEAPFGRDGQGQPIAPHGVSTRTGLPRLKPPGPGRGGKKDPAAAGDKPRVTAAPPPGAVQAAAAARDYTEQLDEIAQGIWAVLSGVPVPWRGPRIRIQAQAAILHMNTPVLVRSCNTIARHNAPFAARVDSLTTGNAAWMLPALFGLAPFVGQSLAMWRSPAAGDVEALAAANEASFRAMLDAAAEQMAAEVLQEHERIQEAANGRSAAA